MQEGLSPTNLLINLLFYAKKVERIAYNSFNVFISFNFTHYLIGRLDLAYLLLNTTYKTCQDLSST